MIASGRHDPFEGQPIFTWQTVSASHTASQTANGGNPFACRSSTFQMV